MLSDFAEPLHLKHDLSSGKCLKIILCSGKDVQLIELLTQLLNSCYKILYTMCMEIFEEAPDPFQPSFGLSAAKVFVSWSKLDFIQLLFNIIWHYFL